MIHKLLRPAAATALALSLAACAQMVSTPPPRTEAANAIAVQDARLRILALSPQVTAAELAPVQEALGAAQQAQASGHPGLAEREALLAQALLDNVQTRLRAVPVASRRASLESEATDLHRRIAATEQSIQAAKAQIGN